MKDMKVQIIEQMVTNLKNMDTLYFIQYGNQTFTNIEEKKEVKRTRAPSKYGYREVITHIRNQIQEPLCAGSTGFIDVGTYDIESVRSTLSSYLTRKYGVDKVSTHIEREKNIIWYVWASDKPFTEAELFKTVMETVNE